MKKNELSILCNTLEGMAADAEDKGRDSIQPKLTLDDVNAITLCMIRAGGMVSPDYKERFEAEYNQLKDRYEKLGEMLKKHDEGTLEFAPSCPIYLLSAQYHAMREYLGILETRAVIEGVSLC